MGEVLAKAIGDPVARMWHDCCQLCCDDCTFESDCNCCRISVQTRPHEPDVQVNEQHDQSV